MTALKGIIALPLESRCMFPTASLEAGLTTMVTILPSLSSKSMSLILPT